AALEREALCEREADGEQRLVVPVRHRLPAHVEHERWIARTGSEPDRHPAADPAFAIRREAGGVDQAAAATDRAADVDPVIEPVVFCEQTKQRGANAEVDATAEVLLFSIEDGALEV